MVRVFILSYFDCDGNCLNDIDGNNICDELEGSYGCTDENACNYDPNAEIDNGSCTYSTSSDFELEFNEEYQLFNNWSMNCLVVNLITQVQLFFTKMDQQLFIWI